MAWNLKFGRSDLHELAVSASGPAVCYGADGCVMPEPEVTAAPAVGDEESLKLREGVADKIVMLCLGLSSGVPLFFVRSKAYVPLMEQTLRKAANGHEVMVRCVILDDGLAVSYRIPPLPDSVSRVALARVADGGIATGFAAFCTMLGLLLTKSAGFAIPWQGVFLSAVAAMIGLFFGILAQWAGRHYGPMLATQQMLV